MIPIVWHEGIRWYGCTKLLNNMFDCIQEMDPKFLFQHFIDWKEVPESEEAVVLIHGDHQISKVQDIQQFLGRFQRSIVINLGDENGYFPLEQLCSKYRKSWTQCSVPGKHDFAKRTILGYPPDAEELLAGRDRLSVDRPIDWFFSGQITHAHRHACVEQLRGLKNGKLLETSGFWQGMARPDYYATMAQSKIIPCPSGPVTPDTFRLWESLEAGCVPIVDASCSKVNFPAGFWEYTIGDVPFPIIHDWKDLPSMIDQELAKWPHNRNKLFTWWNDFKIKVCEDLMTDFHQLRGVK